MSAVRPPHAIATGEVGVNLTYRRDIREMHLLELENVPIYTVVRLQG